MRRRLEPLRERPFGRLLGSYTVNDLGDSVGVVALAVLVFDRTHDVAPTAGFFVVAKFLPALFATGLTARLDQLPVRRTLPTIYVIEAAVFCALALMAERGNFVLAGVLALGFVDGTLAITGRGLTRGAVAAVLQPRGLLTEGNALMNLGFAFSSVFGAALAGGLIAVFGLSVALLVDAASFLVIALILVTSRHLPRLEHSDYEPWHQRVRAGLSFARENRMVRTLLIGQSLALVCFTIVVPIEVIYAKETLGTTSAGYGVLLSAWGAGIVIGSLLFLVLKNKTGFGLILASSAAVGAAYLGMSQANTVLVASLMSVVGGAGNGVQWVAVMTALQENTPAEYQSRIAGPAGIDRRGGPGLRLHPRRRARRRAAHRARRSWSPARGIILLVIGALFVRPAHERHTSTTTGKSIGRRLSRS